MRKLLFTAVGAAALALGSTAANAAALVLSPGATTVVTPPASGTFGDSFNPATPGLFTDVFNITLNGPALTNGSLISVSLNGGNNIDFNPATCPTCTIRLDSTAFTLMSAGTLDTFTLNPTNLAAGPHTLTVVGNIVSGPSAAFSGTINFNTPVPEAATWMMMILGFGAIGFTMRRRRRPVLAQLA
jgi:hypothetical protein